jgi:hypothetical protein
MRMTSAGFEAGLWASRDSLQERRLYKSDEMQATSRAEAVGRCRRKVQIACVETPIGARAGR